MTTNPRVTRSPIRMVSLGNPGMLIVVGSVSGVSSVPQLSGVGSGLTHFWKMILSIDNSW